MTNNSDSKLVYDHIYLLLLLTQLKNFIIKGILDYAIKYKRKKYFDFKQQLLIYIRSKKEIKKSKVVKAIKIS